MTKKKEPVEKTTKKPVVKKAVAKKAPAKKTPVKKAPVKKAPAKPVAKKTPVKKATPVKAKVVKKVTTEKAAPVKATPAKKVVTKKPIAPKKEAVKKAPVKKTTPKKEVKAKLEIAVKPTVKKVASPTVKKVVAKTSVFPSVYSIMKGGKATIIVDDQSYTKTGTDAASVHTLVKKFDKNKTQELFDQIMSILKPNLETLSKHNLVERDGRVYFGDIDVPLPEGIVVHITKRLEEGLDIGPTKKFWFRSLLNPSEVARDGFFDYCMKYGVTITNNGYAVLYKAVASKKSAQTNVDLASFVASEYMKCISTGLDPDIFLVYKRDGEYGIIKPGEELPPRGKVENGLKDLFVDLPSIVNANSDTSSVYTDKHTRKMTIRLGVPVVMDRDKCDPNIKIDCSYGLHVGSHKYVSNFGGVSDTIFACLVDPQHVVAIPEYDTSKIRVCDYLPYATMHRSSNGKWEEIASTHFEVDYEIHEKFTLEERTKELKSQLKGAKGKTKDLIAIKLDIVETRLLDLSHITAKEDDISSVAG